MKSLYQGKKMGGTDGVFAPMLKHLLESMLEGELDNHPQESKGSDDPNRRNGKTRKTVRSLQSGEFKLEGARDRNGTFEPVPKRQLIITAELEDNVIAMYALGMSTPEGNVCDGYLCNRDFQHNRQGYPCDERMAQPATGGGVSLCISGLYVFYKVRDSDGVESRAVYNILGVNRQGKKKLIGVYLSENEGAKFWLSVLTDLKQYGVEDWIFWLPVLMG